MLDFLFPKRKLRRELDAVRASIEVKRAEVEASEREGRRAWGKKWSYIQMHRRGNDDAGGASPLGDRYYGHTDVFEIRLKETQAELKAKELELAKLVERERELAAELGVESTTPSEADGEER